MHLIYLTLMVRLYVPECCMPPQTYMVWYSIVIIPCDSTMKRLILGPHQVSLVGLGEAKRGAVWGVWGVGGDEYIIYYIIYIYKYIYI